MKKGVFKTKRKDNTTVYRVSITKNGKHISLGTYLTEDEASKCYNEAYELLNNNNLKISDYKDSLLISYQKYLSLINFRDNKHASHRTEEFLVLSLPKHFHSLLLSNCPYGQSDVCRAQ